MKLVIQRVATASVTVAGTCVGRISQGLVVLLGIEQGDRMEQVSQLTTKLLKLRLWPDLKDPSKQWASSVVDNKYGLLVVSQFTLFATFKKPKPDFHRAMGGDEANALYEAFVEQCRKGLPDPDLVATGTFGAFMDVDLRNDGPVTVELVAEPSGGGGDGGGGSAKPAAGEPSGQGKATGKAAGAGAGQSSAGACGQAVVTAAAAPPAQEPAERSAAGIDSTAGVIHCPTSIGAKEDALLATQPYLAGFRPGRVDAEAFQHMRSAVPAGLPHVARWAQHVGSFTVLEQASWS